MYSEKIQNVMANEKSKYQIKLNQIAMEYLWGSTKNNSQNLKKRVEGLSKSKAF